MFRPNPENARSLARRWLSMSTDSIPGACGAEGGGRHGCELGGHEGRSRPGAVDICDYIVGATLQQTTAANGGNAPDHWRRRQRRAARLGTEYNLRMRSLQ